MAITLPPLPYAYDALEPYMGRETLELHHDKHHQAYVTNLNNLIEGKPSSQGKSLEEIVTASYGDAAKAGIFNNAGQHWNHNLFWRIDEEGRRRQAGRRAGKRIDERLRLVRDLQATSSSRPASPSSARAGAGSRSTATSSRSSRPRTARTRSSTA